MMGDEKLRGKITRAARKLGIAARRGEREARLEAAAPELLAAARISAGDGRGNGGVHYECRCDGCERLRAIVRRIDGKRYVVCTCGHPDCKRVPVSQ